MDEPRSSAGIKIEPTPPGTAAMGEEGGELGLPQAAALVVGNIVGTGISPPRSSSGRSPASGTCAEGSYIWVKARRGEYGPSERKSGKEEP